MKQFAAKALVTVMVSPLLPFLMLMWLGDWIQSWEWPARYLDRIERIAVRLGVVTL